MESGLRALRYHLPGTLTRRFFQLPHLAWTEPSWLRVHDTEAADRLAIRGMDRHAGHRHRLAAMFAAMGDVMSMKSATSGPPAILFM